MSDNYNSQSPLDFQFDSKFGFNDDDFLKNETMYCPNCDNVFDIKYKKSKFTVCKSCNSYVDLSNNKVLGKASHNFLKPTSHLKLGMKGTIKNIEYEIIGRISFKNTTNSILDQWMLLSEKNEIFWFFYDSNISFSFYELFSPKNFPSFRNEKGEMLDENKVAQGIEKFNGEDVFSDFFKTMILDNDEIALLEATELKLYFIEGEIDFIPLLKVNTRYMAGYGDELDFCCYYENNLKESKFYKGDNYEVKEIYSFFNIRETPYSDEKIFEIEGEFEDEDDEYDDDYDEFDNDYDDHKNETPNAYSSNLNSKGKLITYNIFGIEITISTCYCSDICRLLLLFLLAVLLACMRLSLTVSPLLDIVYNYHI
jgi:hypothetical protein